MFTYLYYTCIERKLICFYRSYHDIGNEGSHDRGHGSHEGGGFEVGPQISADLDGFEEEEIHHINFERDAMGFGFSIRGGAEFNSHMFVLRIAEGGAADVDGQLKVNLIILIVS